MLQLYGITPFVVFDGGPLPMKSGTESGRQSYASAFFALLILMFHSDRALKLQKGKDFLRQGQRVEAEKCFQQCVDVTPKMALNWIRVCSFCVHF